MTIERARANVRQHLVTMERSYTEVKRTFDKQARADMEGYIAALRDVLNSLLEEYEGPGK